MAVLRRLASASFLVLAMMAEAAVPARSGDEIVDRPDPEKRVSRLEARPRDGDARTTAFDETDALATLEGITVALTEVGDGGTYVWHRRDGRLSGMAQPGTSYKNAAGLPCRHLTLMLNAFDRSRRVDGVACRTATGRWQLDG